MTDTPLLQALTNRWYADNVGSLCDDGPDYEFRMRLLTHARTLERQLAAATARLEAAEKRLRYQYSCYVKNCENAGLITNAISYDVWLKAIDAAQGSKP